MKEIEESAGNCPHCGKAQSGDFPMHFLPVGTLLKDKYLVGASIGAGGFGITYVGWDTELDYKVAIKEYFPVGVASRNNTISNEVSFNIVSTTKTR